jgi:hypothetical protein
LWQQQRMRLQKGQKSLFPTVSWSLLITLLSLISKVVVSDLTYTANFWREIKQKYNKGMVSLLVPYQRPVIPSKQSLQSQAN